MLLLVYKYFHGLAPDYILDMLPKNVGGRAHRQICTAMNYTVYSIDCI